MTSIAEVESAPMASAARSKWTALAVLALAQGPLKRRCRTRRIEWRNQVNDITPDPRRA